MTTRATLTEGPVSAHLWRLALPMIVGIVAIMGFNLVDTWFVSKLGELQLAAMSFTFPVVTFISSVAMGLGIGVTSAVSRALGQGHDDRVKRLTTDSLILSTALVASLAAVGVLTIDPLFTALGATPQTLPLIREYMAVWYLGMPCIVVPMVGNSAIRAVGDTRTPAVVMIVVGVANAILDPLLIFGLGPIPAMGIRGAALATVGSRAVTLLVALWVLIRREHMISFERPAPGAVLTSWREVLGVGVPAAATQVVGPLSAGLLTRLVATYGQSAVAGFGAATRIELLALIVPMATSAGLSPFVGQNWGAGRHDRVAEAMRLTGYVALGWGLLSFAALGLGRGVLADAFTQDAHIAAIIGLYLLATPISHGAQGVYVIGNAMFNAAGQPLKATALAVLRTPFLLVGAAWAGHLLLGLPGIFLGVAAANLLIGGATALWTRATLASPPPARPSGA